MDSLPSVRMSANLNSMIRGQQSIERAGRAIVGGDVAHHVVDPDGARGLDPLRASTLDAALEALLASELDGWFLALPMPGSLAPLRGPAPFNLAALDQGEAVVARTAGVGLVPIRVGNAIQWRIFAAEQPLAPSSPHEAERALNEVVIEAAATLSRLDFAAGAPPSLPPGVLLLPGCRGLMSQPALAQCSQLGCCSLLAIARASEPPPSERLGCLRPATPLCSTKGQTSPPSRRRGARRGW